MQVYEKLDLYKACNNCITYSLYPAFFRSAGAYGRYGMLSDVDGADDIRQEEVCDVTFTDEKQLVSCCLSGNEEAWEHLYRRVYRVVHFVTHWKKWRFSGDEADEVMQEVFMGLVTSLKQFTFGCSLETFVSNIAKNRCISELRRIHAQKRLTDRDCFSLSEENEEGLPRVVPVDTRTPAGSAVEEADTRAAVEDALELISDRCRRIISLRYVDDMSYEDMCFLLNLPMGTVASRLKRCLGEFRDLYTKTQKEG